MREKKSVYRYLLLGGLILLTLSMQFIPWLGSFYSLRIYPISAAILRPFSSLFSFSIGDVFVGLCIFYVIAYPFYARHKQKSWKRIGRHELMFLGWIYVWFYWAWGLNYSQPDFYKRAHIPYTSYNKENFQHFLSSYVDSINATYVKISSVDKDWLCTETTRLYNNMAKEIGIQHPPKGRPRVKTMLYSPLASMVGVTGSMAPFFCEFTLNSDLPVVDYPATYTHEMAHLLGIAREAEANFYAYQICTHSKSRGIRFSGYFFVLPHVLINARRLLSEDNYKAVLKSIRPEVISLARENRIYWNLLYSPAIGAVQDWIYDLYLKGNQIESGQKNYSEVVGLLISYQHYKELIQKEKDINIQKKR